MLAKRYEGEVRLMSRQQKREECFKNDLKPAVEARRQNVDNPNSSVVDETLMFLANSFYVYEKLART